LSDLELAWAAGFFDGEGCASLDRHKAGYSYLTLSASQKHPAVLERLAAAVGRGNISGPYKNGGAGGHGYYRWAVKGKIAEEVADMLLPFLSPVKVEQLRRTRAAVVPATRRPGQRASKALALIVPRLV
jgi:hypothetical protein